MNGIQPLDYLCIFGYLVVVVGIGVYLSRNQDIEDFFVAKRSIHWSLVSISIVASLFSTTSFIAIPGEVVKNGLSYSVSMLVAPIAFLFVAYAMLKHFYLLRCFSAYEYLEHRFNLLARCIGAGVFLATRSLYLGMVLYGSAKAFGPVMRIELESIIVTVGVVAIAYTCLGGMKAVIWSDVLQFTIIMLGVSTTCYLLARDVPDGLAGIFNYAFEHEHGWDALRKPEFYQFQIFSSEFYKIRLNFWVIILATFIGVVGQFGTDQMALQRTFATRSLKDCQKSMALNIVWNTVLGSLLYLMGLGLFAYYSHFPKQLTEGMLPDQWATHFIVHGLPSGLTGLMLAALLAAVMSTMDSGIHSLSTVTIADFIQRLGWGQRSDQTDLRLARVLIVVWGTLVIGLSLLICQISEKTETSLLEVAMVWIAASSVLLGMFVLGMFTRRATALGVLVGVAAGGVAWLASGLGLWYLVPEEERISFLWISVATCGTTIIVGYVASITLSALGLGSQDSAQRMVTASDAENT